MISDDLRGKRIGAYARYSTDRQREASIDDQLRRCHEGMDLRSASINESLIYKDEAISGASTDRPGFEALMAKVETGAIDVIVVDEISRLTRDFADAAYIFKRLQYCEVRLISITEGIDSARPGAKTQMALYGLFGELFLDAISTETLRSMVGRFLAGYATGGLTFGYRTRRVAGPDDKTIGHAIEIDEDEAKIVRWIFDLYLAGQSLAGIAVLLNEKNVQPPRAGKKYRKKGWVDSTIRAMCYGAAQMMDQRGSSYASRDGSGWCRRGRGIARKFMERLASG